MHIYLETEPESGVFHYRGKVNPDDESSPDNPVSFAEKMGKSGLRVQQRAAFIGKKIDIDGNEVE